MIRWIFPSRARHPLVRLLAGVIAVAALCVIVAFGFFAAVALAVGGAIFVLVNALRGSLRTSATPPGDAPHATADTNGVIEGEFKVLHGAQPQRQPLH